MALGQAGSHFVLRSQCYLLLKMLLQIHDIWVNMSLSADIFEKTTYWSIIWLILRPDFET